MTDPTEAPVYSDGLLSRWCREHLYDVRDQVFVRLVLRMIATMSLLMATLYVVLDANLVAPWLAGAAYMTAWGWFTPPVILMLHCTMHRPFIRRPKWMARVQPFAMTFFFGIPAGYSDHHVGMHHVEDNMEEDLSSTLRYKRDSFGHFLLYFFRFFFLSLIELPRYLLRKRRVAMARHALVGEAMHFAAIALAVWLDWRFGLAAFVLPYVVVRFMMMTGNWGQHAFINTGRENDGISNAITCINSGYNRRAFNDGYHIGHHLRANRHWTEMPTDFLANRAQYAKEGAVVFERLDFFMVSLLLWTRRWELLARHYVPLDGQVRSEHEVIALLKQRVLPVRDWPQASTKNSQQAA